MRALRADEIEVRIGSVTKKGATFLLYKNARVDMAILDEEYTPMGWQRDHKELKGNIYCGIGVYDEKKGCWVWKWDCGAESYTEKEKGEASDSFKRAGFCWGIGRELYTTPRISIPAVTEKKERGGYQLKNPYEFWGLEVGEIEYDEVDGRRVISKLVLVKDGALVWRWQRPKKDECIDEQTQKKLHSLIAQVKKVDDGFWEELCNAFGFTKLSEVRQSQYNDIVRLAQQRYNKLTSAQAPAAEQALAPAM